MSKRTRKEIQDRIEPRIGFEKSNEADMSLSFSEFEIEGRPPQSSSFFSESEKLKHESITPQSDVVEGQNESQGLNHAFFEENSDSVSDKEISDFFKHGNEKTASGHSEITLKNQEKSVSENSEADEIILSKNELYDKEVKAMEKKKNAKREKVDKIGQERKGEKEVKEVIEVIEVKRKNEGHDIKQARGIKENKETKVENPKINDRETGNSLCCKCKNCTIF